MTRAERLNSVNNVKHNVTVDNSQLQNNNYSNQQPMQTQVQNLNQSVEIPRTDENKLEPHHEAPKNTPNKTGIKANLINHQPNGNANVNTSTISLPSTVRPLPIHHK
jgi:hypothetical protein